MFKKPVVTNTRQHYLLQSLEFVERAYEKEDLNIIEIGCMFKEDEGLSTLSIAKFLAEKNIKGRFVSIDMDASHLDSCRQLIEDRDPTLLKHVEFLCGNSLQILPNIIAEMGLVLLVTTGFLNILSLLFSLEVSCSHRNKSIHYSYDTC